MPEEKKGRQFDIKITAGMISTAVLAVTGWVMLTLWSLNGKVESLEQTIKSNTELRKDIADLDNDMDRKAAELLRQIERVEAAHKVDISVLHRRISALKGNKVKNTANKKINED